jgi:hypothetical protein
MIKTESLPEHLLRDPFSKEDYKLVCGNNNCKNFTVRE